MLHLPAETTDVNSTGRSLRPPYSYSRVHVRWRGCIICIKFKKKFTYCQVNVAQEQLPAFLKTAEKLKIKGLAEGTQGAENE